MENGTVKLISTVLSGTQGACKGCVQRWKENPAEGIQLPNQAKLGGSMLKGMHDSLHAMRVRTPVDLAWHSLTCQIKDRATGEVMPAFPYDTYLRGVSTFIATTMFWHQVFIIIESSIMGRRGMVLWPGTRSYGHAPGSRAYSHLVIVFNVLNLLGMCMVLMILRQPKPQIIFSHKA